MDSYRSGKSNAIPQLSDIGKQPPFTAIDTYRTTKDVVLTDLDAAAESAAQSLVSLKEKEPEFEVVPELHTFQKEEEEFQEDNGPTTLISHLNDPNNEAIILEEPVVQKSSKTEKSGLLSPLNKVDDESS